MRVNNKVALALVGLSSIPLIVTAYNQSRPGPKPLQFALQNNPEEALLPIAPFLFSLLQ